MIIPEGFAQVNWKFTGSAVPNGAEVTMGVNIGGTFDTPEEVAAQCAVAWRENFIPFQSTTITLSSVLCKFGPNDLGPSAEVSDGEDGEQGASAWTPQVAILVRKLTAIGGRAGRGRFFIPGVGESTANESGIIPSDILANWQGAADDFLAQMITAENDPVVLHGEDSPITTPTPITALSVSNTVATQRRRLRG